MQKERIFVLKGYGNIVVMNEKDINFFDSETFYWNGGKWLVNDRNYMIETFNKMINDKNYSFVDRNFFEGFVACMEFIDKDFSEYLKECELFNGHNFTELF